MQIERGKILVASLGLAVIALIVAGFVYAIAYVERTTPALMEQHGSDVYDRAVQSHLKTASPQPR